MVNGKYISGNGIPALEILRLFGWPEDFKVWEKFTDWLWYTYPTGLWISV